MSDFFSFNKGGDARKAVRNANKIRGAGVRTVGLVVALIGLASTFSGLISWHPLGMSALGAGSDSVLGPGLDFRGSSPALAFNWTGIGVTVMPVIALCVVVAVITFLALFTTESDTSKVILAIPLLFGAVYGAYISWKLSDAVTAMHKWTTASPSLTVNTLTALPGTLTPYGHALYLYALEPGYLQSFGAIVTAFGSLVALLASLLLYRGIRARQI
ncbi:MAG TPA: hypothetical protein VGS21_05020 [Acidimicrobiales bacterium]|nr:hypothetical protein [Acidimicrobiales bacterium]